MVGREGHGSGAVRCAARYCDRFEGAAVCGRPLEQSGASLQSGWQVPEAIYQFGYAVGRVRQRQQAVRGGWNQEQLPVHSERKRRQGDREDRWPQQPDGGDGGLEGLHLHWRSYGGECEEVREEVEWLPG